MDLRLAVLIAALGLALTTSATAAAQCVGDCRDDGEVTIDEVMLMVHIALDNTAVEECQPGDTNTDGVITVNEIIAAVSKALRGCFPDVAGTWRQDQVRITSSTCAPAITAVVQDSIAAGESNCTFQIEQRGAHLDITSSCPDEIDIFEGSVDANGLLTVTSSEQETEDGCTITRTENTSGMVVTSPTVGTQTMDLRFAPGCGFANCTIVVQARWTRLAT
jgi:hypothetical protein